MNILDAVCLVLHQAGEPLHYRDITQRLIGQGLWRTSSPEPEKLLLSIITRHIRQDPRNARIHRFDWGVYGLRPEPASIRDLVDPPKPSAPPTLDELEIPEDMSHFSSVAVKVLAEAGPDVPLHYTEIARRAIARGLIPDTPDAEEIMLRELRAETQTRVRLMYTGQGLDHVRLSPVGRVRFALILTPVPLSRLLPHRSTTQTRTRGTKPKGSRRRNRASGGARARVRQGRARAR